MRSTRDNSTTVDPEELHQTDIIPSTFDSITAATLL